MCQSDPLSGTKKDLYMENLREKLVKTALQWERAFGVAPSITSAISEFDAAMLVDFTINKYSESMQGTTAVRKGFDFIHNDKRYQVKGNRPSGKPGSKVTKVSKAKNYHWDYLVWVLYDPLYQIQEAWCWTMSDYADAFDARERLSPDDMRMGKGKRLK